MSNLQSRNFGLDFARSVAITLVVLSHFAHKNFAVIGFWGVELFFALSGYLIGQILWRSFSNAPVWHFGFMRNFWSRRWWRTLPNYYLFLFITLWFAYYTNAKIPSVAEFTSFLWFGGFLLNGTLGFFSVSWSLCIEEWFYLLFPLVLFTVSKFKFKAKTSFIVTLALFFITCMVIRVVLTNQNIGFALKTTTFARLDAIACGVSIAFLTTNVKVNLLFKRLMFITGAMLFLSPVFIAFIFKVPFNDLIINPLVLLIVPMGFALSLPLINLLPMPQGMFSFVSLCVRNLSLWSYSLYLVHLPVMFFIYSWMEKARGNVYLNFSSKIIGLGISIIIAGLLYRFFEVPLTKKRPHEINH